MLERLKSLAKRKENKSLTPQQMADKLRELELQDKQTESSSKRLFLLLQNLWSTLLALALVSSIAFQFWLAYYIGTGRLNFNGYETFLNIVAGESFVQVVGLCLVIVKYLFPNSGSKK